jgi:hypothetical protein
MFCDGAQVLVDHIITVTMKIWRFELVMVNSIVVSHTLS